jgi:hypothetical protein
MWDMTDQSVPEMGTHMREWKYGSMPLPLRPPEEKEDTYQGQRKIKVRLVLQKSICPFLQTVNERLP